MTDYTNTVLCYIGLGSNLNNPTRQVLTAIKEVSQFPDTRVLKQSSLYVTDPIGPQNQPDFVNAVIAIETSLSPQQLLSKLQHLEVKHLRERNQLWGPRTLDCDILLYSNLMINEPQLTVPHVELHKRLFALIPLAELAPDLLLPGLGSIQKIIANLPETKVEKLVSTEEPETAC